MCDSMVCYLATWELYFLVELIDTALDIALKMTTEFREERFAGQ